MAISVTVEKPRSIFMNQSRQAINNLYTDKELLNLLTRSEEDIKAGRTYTMNQVRKKFSDRYDV